MSTLSLKNINKIYPNNVQAVFDFNLDIKDKEFIVLVGPSGCGKSTTLRMIAGLEDITYGELTIDGQIMNNVEPMNRHISMVFQNYALYPHMTVYKNMAFALQLRKRNMNVYVPDERVDELNAQMGQVYKKIRKVDAKYKKDQNNLDLLQQHIDLYKEVFAINDEIEKLRQPIMGVNEVHIKDLQKKLADFEKEIKDLEKQVNSNREFADGEVEALREGIEQRQKFVEKIIAEIEDYTNNEHPIQVNRHLTKREIDIEINKVAASIDLTRYLFRKPAALSGGQRQRVALGRAIVRKPKVFLMDEPLSNLDAKLRVQTRSEISKLHKRVGATTIYVTHDQTEAMTMADRIVIMKDGYIQQVGTPDEVYNDPANKFVGGFIGSPSMNFIPGKVNKETFTFDGTKVEVKTDVKALKDAKDREVILGIRPEDLYLKGDKNNENPSKPFEAVVTYSELLGSSLIVYANVGQHSILFEAKATDKVKIGDKLQVCADLKKMYFFDKETEARIK